MSDRPPRVTIRQPTPADAEALAALVRALARHEGKTAAAHVTSAAISAWLFGAEPAFEALLAELDGRSVGYLAFYHGFSLFRGERVLLVENLYVEEGARGHGVGRYLLAAVAAEAGRRGLGRLEINVRNDSRATRAFYEHLGIAAAGEGVYRVEDEALAAIAAGSLEPAP
jgi:GNAT superfamily N-acetyltransferase